MAPAAAGRRQEATFESRNVADAADDDDDDDHENVAAVVIVVVGDDHKVPGILGRNRHISQTSVRPRTSNEVSIPVAPAQEDLGSGVGGRFLSLEGAVVLMVCRFLLKRS